MNPKAFVFRCPWDQLPSGSGGAAGCLPAQRCRETGGVAQTRFLSAPCTLGFLGDRPGVSVLSMVLSVGLYQVVSWITGWGVR